MVFDIKATQSCLIQSLFIQTLLSKPQPNLNTTVVFDMKMTVQTPPTPPQKLNISNISAVTDLILMKL